MGTVCSVLECCECACVYMYAMHVNTCACLKKRMFEQSWWLRRFNTIPTH